jgi:hypothetical protein
MRRLRQIDNGYVEGKRGASAGGFNVRPRQQRRYPQFTEVAAPFVSGEARIERYTDRTGRD